MKVVDIQEYRCRDIIHALEFALEAARRGEIRGLAICASGLHGPEKIALVGSYLNQPALGLAAVTRMFTRISALQDERDEAYHTST